MVGAILLLANLGIISLEIEFSWSTIYPVLLVGIGLKLWGDSLLKQGGILDVRLLSNRVWSPSNYGSF